MSELNAPRELHGSRLLGYAIGQFGMLLTNMFVGVFIMQFYVYTINLDSILFSIGISMQLIISAFSSIFFGIIADNKKPGRFGKRRPFMLYGLPLWIFTSIIIWYPPKCPESNQLYFPTAIFLWVILIINTISGSSIFTVHLSMLTEQSQTHENREKIAALTTIFTIISSILALLLPIMVQSILPDPRNVKWWEPSGEYILFYIPLIGISFTLFGLIAVITTFFSIDESFHKSSTPIVKKKNFRTIFPQMIEPIKDKKYRKLLFVILFNGMAGRILGALIFPFLTFALLFTGERFYLYILVSIASKFIGFVIWRRILKKHNIIKTYTICILAAAVASLSDLIFLINRLPNLFVVILFIFSIGTILGSMYGFGLFNPPLASALVYEAAENNKEFSLDEAVSNISGAYFGLNSFFMSIGSAICSLLIGFILTGSNAENSIILTLTFSSMGIFYLISLLFIRKLKLKK
ncbi:MAG: MFS transporter [Promethearchaeota archaeon]